MQNKLLKLLSIGIINTLRFNIRYFGLGGILHPRFIVSRDVKILCLKGSVEVDSNELFAIRLGFPSVAIFDYKYERGIWNNTGNIRFKGKAALGNGFRISNSGELLFGDGFSLTAKTSIVCSNRIRFGKNNLVSWDVLIMDLDFHSIYSKQSNQLLNPTDEIYIEDNVWIGCRCLLLKGARIGHDSVIAAGSTINGLNQSNAIIGNLNRVIREDIYWRC